MNLIQINNLRELINLQYPGIVLNPSNLKQFLNIPWEAAKFYPFKGRDDQWDKKGFFNNGKTAVWSHSAIPINHTKIAVGNIQQITHGWSILFSFEEEGSADRIKRMMQMKAFW